MCVRVCVCVRVVYIRLYGRESGKCGDAVGDDKRRNQRKHYTVINTPRLDNRPPFMSNTIDLSVASKYINLFNGRCTKLAIMSSGFPFDARCTKWQLTCLIKLLDMLYYLSCN